MSTKLKEQVLMVKLPDATPDVHIASLHADDHRNAHLTLTKASVPSEGGAVTLGKKRQISLANVFEVKMIGSKLLCLGLGQKASVELSFETTEDAGEWLELLGKHSRGPERAILPKQQGQGTIGESGELDEEMCLLKAHCQKLQTKVGDLEADGEKRDKQLQTMSQRLESAMKMLNAVQDMCDQQWKVIEAQRVALQSLQGDLGEFEGEEKGAIQYAENDAERDEEAEADGAEAMEAEIQAKMQQMTALQRQAENMSRMLVQLQAFQQKAEDVPSAGTQRLETIQRFSQTSDAQEPASTTTADDSGDVEAVLAKLQSLQMEKARYEDMLRNSQEEHETLAARLNDMQSLMRSLNMNADDVAVGRLGNRE